MQFVQLTYIYFNLRMDKSHVQQSVGRNHLSIPKC